MISIIKQKYFFILIFLLFAVFFIVDIILSKKIDTLSHNSYVLLSNNLKEQIQKAIDNKAISTLNIAISLSENSSYKDFLNNKDKLNIDLKKVSSKINEYSNFKNVWIQLIDKKGISKYRSWTEKEGDNIADVREELKKLLKTPKVSSVISVGIFDMTFKSIVPIYDKNNSFLGFIEVITKMNSIAKDFEQNGLDLIILADKKYKNQIKKPFTNMFLEDYYIANLNAKKELIAHIKRDIPSFIDLKDFKLINNYFVTTYQLKNLSDENMGYFIIFKNSSDIDLSEIRNFEKAIKIIGILLAFFVITFFSSIYFYNKSKYTKELENDVGVRTKKINELTKRYKQIFENSKAIKLIIDPKTQKILDANEAAVKFYGYNRKKFLTLFMKDLNPISTKEHNENFEKVLNSKENIFQFKHKLANGEIKDVEVYASPIEINNNTFVYSIIRDISEELNVQKKLEEKEKLFYQQAKMASMGEMLENIAHQWRQPLSIITTAASGTKIKKEFDQLDDSFFFESIDLITKSANYLSHTIDDFRDFFKQSKDKEEFKLLDIVQNSIKLTNIKNSVDIELFSDDIKIFGFKNELIQVFINLLNNSKDALIQSKKEIKYIKISAKKIDNNVIITILDNAGGIDENLIDKIFDPYFTTKHQSQGTGIGLYMSQQIIIQHFKGQMSVTNVNFKQKNKEFFGAKFKIELPLLNS